MNVHYIREQLAVIAQPDAYRINIEIQQQNGIVLPLIKAVVQRNAAYHAAVGLQGESAPSLLTATHNDEGSIMASTQTSLYHGPNE